MSSLNCRVNCNVGRKGKSEKIWQLDRPEKLEKVRRDKGRQRISRLPVLLWVARVGKEVCCVLDGDGHRGCLLLYQQLTLILPRLSNILGPQIPALELVDVALAFQIRSFNKKRDKVRRTRSASPTSPYRSTVSLSQLSLDYKSPGDRTARLYRLSTRPADASQMGIFVPAHRTDASSFPDQSGATLLRS